ncbi:magnesium and cobalt transport protein [Salmonella enterica subsp. diarizonae]|uniref:Magnesium and cobalt transport protein n=1 Tax=Salmonella diarizonae TaxID=59204 RepID=A0A379U8A6_SALDZ|nr:magnesium and cobalt transport protein [Salmonella enterica subsp. diarizonae]
MLSAFQLEKNRLTRLEVEESQTLIDAVWIDLVEPDDDERLRVQSELGQSLATRPELEDIEASARFFEDEDGLHIHSFFFFEDAEDHAGNSTVAFTIRDGRLFTLRERELPPSVCIVCAPAVRRWSTVMLMNYCSICSKPKLNNWRMKSKTSTAIWKN